MSDIFREVDEDLRRERFERLWKRYGRYLVGTAVAIVVAVALTVAWREWQERQRAQDAAIYLAALGELENGAEQQAHQRLEQLVSGGSSTYAMLARFNEAALQAEAGATDLALDGWRILADDRSVPQTYREVASLLWALHGLDVLDPSEVIAEVEPLAEPDGPWRHTAREIVALAALRDGDVERARDTLTTIGADPGAPGSVRERADQILTTLD